MQLPFTTDEFFGTFSLYNVSVWPMQIVLYAIGIAAVSSVLVGRFSGKIMPLALAFFWMWMAIVYHFGFFAGINPAANIFGSLFLFQVVLYIVVLIKNPNRYKMEARGWHGYLGLCLILFSMVVYPYLSARLGHSFPASPTFGLPCPTTIFTFGAFFLAYRNIPRCLIVIPVIWSFIGGSAAVLLEVKEDYSLIASGIIALLLFVRRKAGKTVCPTK